MIKGTMTAKPQAFAAAVTWAAKFLALRPAAPVQGGMRLTVEGGELTVETFSEDVKARALLPVEGDASGSVIVSGRLLGELVKTFPDKPVQIGVDEESLTIAVGRWEGTLPEMVEDWPADTFLEPPVIGTVDGTAFSVIVAQAGAAATDDEKKPAAYHCVYLAFASGAVTAYATDGSRMGRGRTGFERAGAEDTSALVTAHTLVDAASAFVGPDPIAVSLGPSAMALTSATRQVLLKQTVLDGGYGIVETIDHMMAVDHPRVAGVRVADLLMPMKRANLMRDSKEGPIGLAISDGMISVNAKASDINRKGAEEVDADYVGPGYAVAVNPKFLADALGSAPGDTVAVKFNEADQRPGRPWHIVLTVPGDEAWCHVVMPMKMR